MRRGKEAHPLQQLLSILLTRDFRVTKNSECEAQKSYENLHEIH